MYAVPPRVPDSRRYSCHADRRSENRGVTDPVSVLASLPEGATVALIRLRSLGDCVLTTPALRILKEARPDLRIGVLVEDRFGDIFAGNPDVSAILLPSLRALRRF